MPHPESFQNVAESLRRTAVLLESNALHLRGYATTIEGNPVSPDGWDAVKGLVRSLAGACTGIGEQLDLAHQYAAELARITGS